MCVVFEERMHCMAIGLVLIALLAGGASANVISIENGLVTTAGTTDTMLLVLDSAPDGLAGYSINVTITDPSVAMITDVSFPSWATLSRTSPFPSADCRLLAVDLQKQVQAGAAGVPLATLTIAGLRDGSTTVSAMVNLMNDDTEVTMLPAISSGTISVGGSGGAQQPVPEFPAAGLPVLLAGAMAVIIYLFRKT